MPPLLAGSIDCFEPRSKEFPIGSGQWFLTRSTLKREETTVEREKHCVFHAVLSSSDTEAVAPIHAVVINTNDYQTNIFDTMQ